VQTCDCAKAAAESHRGSPHGSGLGVHRYVVVRTIGLLHWFGRR
jgi:hypothetical protein